MLTSDLILEQLRKYKWLCFDLSEYIRSSKHLDELRRIWTDYSHLVAGEESGGVTATSLHTALRRELSASVAAYEPFANSSSFYDLPVLDKAAVAANAESFINTRRFSSFRLKNTTGTTGPRLQVYYAEPFYFSELLLSVRKIAATKGISNVCRPIFAVSLVTGNSWPDSLFLDPFDEVGALLRLRFDETNTELCDLLLDRLKLLNPAILVGNPEILECFLQSVESRGDLGWTPMLVVSSGAMLSDELRNRLMTAFQCSVANAYALSEFGLVASECDKHNLHVDTSSILLEIEKQHPKDQTGKIILSSLANLGMPLLRYRTEDQASLMTGQCQCGIKSPVIQFLVGKKQKCLISSTGRMWRLSRVPKLARECNFSRCVITKATANELHLQVVSEVNQEGSARVSALIDKIYHSCPWPIQVHIEHAERHN